ncbi:MAG TPA: hypothetical protein VK604_11800 [Bryobacteraceae bacterium]|nr:hypothetical protein [Bryobacteraceae bacterium]
MSQEQDHGHIQMPAPTFWPMVLAFGLTLLFAGMVTHWAVSIIGLVILSRAVKGWWSNVIPHEEHEAVAVEEALRPAPIVAGERLVVRLKLGEGGHRVRVPERIHPYSSGFWGGLAGGAAMAVLACLYGLIAQHSIWFPINLLAGAVLPDLGKASLEELRAFNGLAFGAALVGHGIISILVGVLYAVMLPMFPKYAVIWAGIVSPLLWSGMVATILDVVNPAMNARISWPWFVAAQLGFGLVGGYVVARSTSIRTMQSWTLAERAFLETPGSEDKE